MVIGLTGGIGTGKSAVSKILQNKGYFVIDLDIISRDIIKNIEVKKKLIESFGTEIIENNNNINFNKMQNKFISINYENIVISRKKLGSIVFQDKQKLSILNSIMHPAILFEMRNQISEAKKTNKIVIVEIQLLFEIKLECEFDRILLVYSSKENQIKRVIKRDNRTEKEALDIINSQMNLDEKAKKSHYIIYNNGSLEDLEKEVEKEVKLWENL